jgi:hypothetical protein
LITIAIQVAVTAEAPTRWQLAKEATRQAIADLPHTLKTAVQDLVSGALARPLLSIGVGLGSLALGLLLLRGSGRNETRP